MKTLICIPCMDMVHTDFMKCLLGMRRVGETKITISCSSLIYDARNSMARRAVKEGFDRVLWLDSDMTFEPDLMERLSARLDEGRDYVSGLYFTRKAPVRPVLYKTCGYYENEDGVRPMAVWYDDYPRDDIFKVEATGFGGVMMTTDLIKRVADKFGLPFSPMLGFGEDLSFCGRVMQCGEEMWVDSTIKMGHVGLGTITESTYLSQKEESDGQHDTGDNAGGGEVGASGNDDSV